jgi:hypothetical protein
MTISIGYLPIRIDCTANQLMSCIETKMNIHLFVLNLHQLRINEGKFFHSMMCLNSTNSK